MDSEKRRKIEAIRELQEQARAAGDVTFVAIAEKEIHSTLNPPTVAEQQKRASEVIRRSRGEG